MDTDQPDIKFLLQSTPTCIFTSDSNRKKRTISINIEHAECLLEVGNLIFTKSVLSHDKSVKDKLLLIAFLISNCRQRGEGTSTLRSPRCLLSPGLFLLRTTKVVKKLHHGRLQLSTIQRQATGVYQSTTIFMNIDDQISCGRIPEYFLVLVIIGHHNLPLSSLGLTHHC